MTRGGEMTGRILENTFTKDDKVDRDREQKRVNRYTGDEGTKRDSRKQKRSRTSEMA